MENSVWKVKEQKEEVVAALCSKLGCSEILARLLANRGLEEASGASVFLHPSLDQLRNPYLLKDMDRAVERMHRAVKDGEKVMVFGDRDVDGITSTALIRDLFLNLKLPHVVRIPMDEEGYGISHDALDEAKQKSVSLLITVDCGISAVEEVEYARGLGVDMIILDHHQQAEVLPAAAAVVDPSRKDCGYPFKGLSGCGVAFKFAQAVLMARDKHVGEEIVVFDLETMGFNSSSDAILEIGASRYQFGIEKENFQVLIVPDASVPAKITELTGLTNEKLKREGIPEEEALERFLSFIGDTKLVAHNAPFDEEFLCARVKKKLNRKVKNEVIDTLKLARKVFPGLAGGHSLGALCEYLGIDLENAHRAVDDARATAAIYRKILARQNPRLQSFLKGVLDLVTLSTISDVVPLVDENRCVVTYGLPYLQKTKREGLRQALDAVRRDNDARLRCKDVSWSLTPLLNSAGRVGSPEKALDLLLCDEGSLASRLLQQILGFNRRRKELSKNNLEALDEFLHAQTKLDEDRILVVLGEGLEHGVSGVVANRLSERYGRPVIVLLKDSDGLIRGSARSTDDVHIVKALKQCEEFLVQYGGHPAAAGLTVIPERIDDFKEKIKKVVYEMLGGAMPMATLEAEAVLSIESINGDLLADLDKLEPTGHANDMPLFFSRSVPVVEARALGVDNKHLRLKLGDAQLRPVATGLWWGHGERVSELKEKEIDLVYTVEPNVWRGKVTPQLIIKDLKLSEEK